MTDHEITAQVYYIKYQLIYYDSTADEIRINTKDEVYDESKENGENSYKCSCGLKFSNWVEAEKHLKEIAKNNEKEKVLDKNVE